MITAVTIFHVVVCVLLVLLVLVQDSKGAMGATFGGGGSNSLLGAVGAETLFSKMTKILAIVFALTCIFLTRQSSLKSGSVFDGAKTAPKAAPAQAPVESEPAKAPTNSEDTSTSK